LAEKIVVCARRREDTRYVNAPVCGGDLLGSVVIYGVFGK
jgi:hypothetical protein